MANFNYEFSIEKSLVNDDLYVYGVASTQDKDRDGERINMGSLEKAFHKFMSKAPVLMYNHSVGTMAVGKVVAEFVGEDGTIYKSGIVNNQLHIVGLISKAQGVSDIRIQIKEGILRSFSVGGKAQKIQKNGNNCLMIQDLQEISIVPIPANDEAMFNVIKSACEGDNCKLSNKKLEEIEMEQTEIVEIVAKTIAEIKESDKIVELQKKFDALAASKVEVETPDVDVVKALTDQVENLKIEIAEMKTTPIEKGVQDGDVVNEVTATDITSVIMKRYGGN